MAATNTEELRSKLPSPPFCHVEGIENFRDIGGYAVPANTAQNPSSSTKSIRRHFIYRCADPTKITPTGQAVLRDDLGIRTIFDLRSAPELAKSLISRGEPARIEGVERFHTPAFPNQDMSPGAMAWNHHNYLEGGPSGFTKAYREILQKAPPSFRTILLHIRDEPDKPLLMHCSGGKDRTGILTALILTLAGVDDDVIANEYELTETGLLPMKEVILQWLMREPELKDNKEGVMKMISAKRENMLAALQMVREEYGGFDSYVKNQCALTDDDIEIIRKNITTEDAPIL